MQKHAGSLTAPRSFVITVDVEADNEWEFTDAPPTYRGITALPRLQRLCDRYQVQPTYLVTFDVACDPDSAKILRELAADGRCEIGAHMHPWRTPPFYPELDCDTGYRPYLYDYPEEIQAQKMATLTRCLEDVFQRPITSHRAGRWGIDAFGCDLLEEHGYVVDTSVTPLLNRRRQSGFVGGSAGPDYLNAPSAPYHPSRDDVSVPGGRKLLEIPTSVGSVCPVIGRVWRESLVRRLGGAGFAGEAAMRLLQKMKVLRVVSLNPAHSGQRDMHTIVERGTAIRNPVVNMAFHSSELVSGASPSVMTEADVSRVWSGIGTVLDAAVSFEQLPSSGVTTTALGLIQSEVEEPDPCGHTDRTAERSLKQEPRS